MKVSTERIEGCQMAVTVEVEPDEMEKALDGAYKRLVNRVDIPGFRKGKAPRALLERHIGKESLETEALERLVPELYDRAVEDEGIDAIGRPDLEMTQTDPPIFKATVPLRPVVELGDYWSIRVEPEKVEITEENIEQGIENLRRMQATWEPVEREAQIDDVVTIDVQGTVGDENVLDAKGSQYRVVPDMKMPVPGFAEQIVGMKAGDEKEFTLPFPEDHESEDLAGKDCRFKVTVTDVKEERLPDVDDEFAKSMGQGIENMEQLKERLRENMRAAAERDARDKLEAEVMDQLVAQSTVEFPDMLTDHEIDHLIRDQLQRFGGMKLEDYLRYRSISEEQLRSELRPAAEKRVTGSLLLNKVHEVENISVSDADLQAEIDRMVESAGDESGQARQFLNTPDARESIRGRMLVEKTLNVLIDIATEGVEPVHPEASAESDAGAAGPESSAEEETPDDSA